MSPVFVAVLTLGALMLSALIGVAINRKMPLRYKDEATKDHLKTAMGLVGTLTTLVLGLIVATAKSSYDEKAGQTKQLAAKIIHLDAVLAQYGQEAAPIRVMLRQAVAQAAERIWQGEDINAGAFAATSISVQVIRTLDALAPSNDVQRINKSRAVQLLADITEQRLLLFARSGSVVPILFLLVVTTWLCFLFMGFTILSQTNSVGFATIGIAAVSLSGAIFLILELDHPFNGLLRIPSSLLLGALAPM